jgi:hypothetical protein
MGRRPESLSSEILLDHVENHSRCHSHVERTHSSTEHRNGDNLVDLLQDFGGNPGPLIPHDDAQVPSRRGKLIDVAASLARLTCQHLVELVEQLINSGHRAAGVPGAAGGVPATGQHERRPEHFRRIGQERDIPLSLNLKTDKGESVFHGWYRSRSKSPGRTQRKVRIIGANGTSGKRARQHVIPYWIGACPRMDRSCPHAVLFFWMEH